MDDADYLAIRRQLDAHVDTVMRLRAQWSVLPEPTRWSGPAHSGALPGDVIGAHEKEAYLHTASKIDTSASKRLADMVKNFPRFARGTVTVFSAGPV